MVYNNKKIHANNCRNLKIIKNYIVKSTIKVYISQKILPVIFCYKYSIKIETYTCIV